jgi:SAM-dependent methyltransferase
MRIPPNDARIASLYEGRTGLVGHYLGWYHDAFLASGVTPGWLLDLGCGTGDFVAAAARREFVAQGVDQDGIAIAAGRRHYHQITLHEANIEAFLRSDRQQYDVITFFEVLEHLENPAGFLAAVRERLRPGGTIGLSVPNNDSPLLAVYRRLTRVVDVPPHHLTRWNKQALRSLFAREGFDVVSVSVLPPTFSDLVQDTCWMRLRRLSLPTRLRIGAVVTRCVRPTDPLARAFIGEGRGMFILARRGAIRGEN